MRNCLLQLRSSPSSLSIGTYSILYQTSYVTGFSKERRIIRNLLEQTSNGNGKNYGNYSPFCEKRIMLLREVEMIVAISVWDWVICVRMEPVIYWDCLMPWSSKLEQLSGGCTRDNIIPIVDLDERRQNRVLWCTDSVIKHGLRRIACAHVPLTI